MNGSAAETRLLLEQICYCCFATRRQVLSSKETSWRQEHDRKTSWSSLHAWIWMEMRHKRLDWRWPWAKSRNLRSRNRTIWTFRAGKKKCGSPINLCDPFTCHPWRPEFSRLYRHHLRHHAEKILMSHHWWAIFRTSQQASTHGHHVGASLYNTEALDRVTRHRGFERCLRIMGNVVLPA